MTNINRLERPQEAMDDANKALEYNSLNTKAIVAKGESLYKMGEFESALVQFHRGLRLRRCPVIKRWMTRCTDEIRNTVGQIREYDKVGVINKLGLSWAKLRLLDCKRQL